MKYAICMRLMNNVTTIKISVAMQTVWLCDSLNDNVEPFIPTCHVK